MPQGISAELIATLEGFGRDDVDGYALRSQDRAAKAQAGGHFARSVLPVRDRNGLEILAADEHPRPGTTRAGLAALKPSFAGLDAFDAVARQQFRWLEAIEHVHHAGNSSGIVDGASLVLIGTDTAGRELGLEPRGRIVAAGSPAAYACWASKRR